MTRKVAVVSCEFLVLGLVLNLASRLAAESLTLTSYYPSPAGNYRSISASQGANFATSSGNVGIGTTNPWSKLDVTQTASGAAFSINGVGTNRGSSVYFRHDNAVTATWSIQATDPSQGDGLLTILAPQSRPFAISTGGSDKFYINSNGNVGIGATNLLQKLHVAGGGYFSGNVGIGVTNPLAKLHIRNDVNGAATIMIQNENTGSSSYEGLDLDSEETGTVAIRSYDNTNTSLPSQLTLFNQRTAGNIGFQTAGSERMRIAANGDVGIGTTNPNSTYKMHIYENVNSQTGLLIQNPNTGASNVSMLTLATDSPSAMIIKCGANNTTCQGGAGALDIQNTASGKPIVFWTNSGGTNAERMRIGGNGNVGIGDTTPDYKLEVNGSAGKPGGGSWTASSDIRLKKDIKPLDDALDRILKLRGVYYEWKKPEGHGNLVGPQMGMIGQEVEKVFPQWVGIDSKGYKTLTFMGFEALTTEAVRELHARIKQLTDENEQMKLRLDKLEKRLAEK